MNREELKHCGFVLSDEINQPSKYFTIKIHELKGNNNNEIMINIVDNSHFLKYKD